MRKAIDAGLIVLVLIAAYLVYSRPAPVTAFMHSIGIGSAPCAKPLTYSIGSIDPRFGISKDLLVADLADAEQIWEAPSKKDLFLYEPSGGAVTVNLVYDNRQAATDKLQSEGVQIDSSRASYDALKAQFTTVAARVESEQAAYLNAAAAYKQHEASYNSEVEQANRRGGATPAEYEHLQAEKSDLQTELAAAQSLAQKLNGDIDTANALATTLNQLIKQLNLNVAEYNQVGVAAGEFEEGLYQSKNGVQTITIYEYSGHTSLVRVLAHELGHALGLEHVDDPSAIMYKVNRISTLEATAADLAELARACASEN